MMKGSMSTDLGIITINPEVIAKYAGSMAIECFGIVGMAAVNMKDGLVHLLKRESLTRGIHVEITEDNVITLDFHVIVSYGVNILSVSDNLMNNVKYKVEEFTGMKVDKITIKNNSKCSRNRCRTHYENMWQVSFTCKHFSLFYAKTMLFIRHHKCQIVIDCFLLYQCVCSYNN